MKFDLPTSTFNKKSYEYREMQKNLESKNTGAPIGLNLIACSGLSSLRVHLVSRLSCWLPLYILILAGTLPYVYSANPIASFNGLPETLEPSLYQLEKAFRIPQLGLTRLSHKAGEEPIYFATSKGGMIYSFKDLSNPTFQVVLNLTDATFSRGGESGLMSLAVHPNFDGNGHFFIFYTTLIETDNGVEEYDRLSRFTTTNGEFAWVDRDTEVILFQQLRQISLHHGGDLKFGPDGYLYVSLGDASRLTDEEENSQKIDGDFHAGILRIDVNEGDSNLEPNPHPGVMGNYRIPKDNPFIDTHVLHGLPIDRSKLRTEFYAIGLRNPWAISFDPETNELFAIDTGQSAFEEVNRITKGANYGWSFVEGNRIHYFKRKEFVDYESFEPPLLQYPHTRGNLAISGGTLYRGKLFPELNGHFIFADWGGNIGAFDPYAEVPQETLKWLARLHGCSVVFSEPSSGEILFGEFVSGQVHRLRPPSTEGGLPPRLLSEIGFFQNMQTLEPVPGLIPYEVNLSFWSDGAKKHRWFALPDSNAKFQFDEKGPWGVPDKSVFLKHFEMEMIENQPDSTKRIETRLLVKTDDTIYGVSYQWNDAGTDAELVPATGLETPLQIVDKNGVKQNRSWLYPSRTECLTCHTKVGGEILGLNTLQLNHYEHGRDQTANQIERFAEEGYIAGVPKNVWSLPAYAATDDETKSVEYRARSYLGANCSYCHQPGGPTRARWDARFYTPTDQMGLIDTNVRVYSFWKNHKLIQEGNPDRSMVTQRLALLGAYYMPPIGSYRVNKEGYDLISEWIRDVIPANPSYGKWQFTQFEELPVEDWGPGNDPDQDKRTNHLEFLLGTDPLTPDTEAWKVSILRDGTKVRIEFPHVANLGFQISYAENLDTPIKWNLLNHSEEDLLYPSKGEVVSVEDTVELSDARFYRVEVLSLWR